MLWHSTRRNRRPVRKSRGKWIGAAVVGARRGVRLWRSGLVYQGPAPPIRVERILAAYQGEAKADGIVIREPLDGTLFPPDMIAPTFRWDDPRDECNLWLVTINFSDGSERGRVFPASPRIGRPRPAIGNRSSDTALTIRRR